MKGLAKICSITLISILSLFIGGCSNDTEVVNPEVKNSMKQTEFVDNLSKPISDYSKEEVLKEVLPVLQEFIDSQFSYAMGEDKEPQWNNYLWKADMKLKQMVDDVVARDKYRGRRTFSYSGSLYTDMHTKISLSGDMWYLNYVYNKMNIKNGVNENIPVSQIIWIYSFGVKKDKNNQWKIVKWRDDEGITENSIWYRGDLDVIKDVTSYRRSSSSYFPNKAVKYATKYWKNPNLEDWCNYSSYGGDCTNFVSQCLEAGGWNQKKGARYCSNSVWFHKGARHKWNNVTPKNYSCSWTIADKFFQYMEQIPNVTKLWLGRMSVAAKIGDVISLKRGDKATHTMLVTRVDSWTGEIFVTFRNGDDDYHPPLNDFPLKYYNDKYLYYWRIHGGN